MLFGEREKEIGPDLGLFISWAEGDIYFSKNGQIWEVADNTMLLTNGTRLRTGKDTKAILQTPQGSSMRMNENTEIKVVHVNERDLLLVQHSGRTYHRVKMANEGIYQVRALNHTMKAVGTAFDVSTNVKANRINVKSLEGKNIVSGTIFGKTMPRILRINDFYLEAIPEGHNLLIYNQDVPGVIGRIATKLGKHSINIGRMGVGQEKEKQQNVILLNTNVSVSDDILEELRDLEHVFSARRIEL